jgi:hypothetical protein
LFRVAAVAVAAAMSGLALRQMQTASARHVKRGDAVVLSLSDECDAWALQPSGRAIRCVDIVVAHSIKGNIQAR